MQTITAITKNRLLFTLLAVTVQAVQVFSQIPKRAVPGSQPAAEVPQEDNTLYYILILLLVIGLVAAIGWLYKSKKEEKAKEEKRKSDEKAALAETDAVDLHAELEWFKNATRKKKANEGENGTSKSSAKNGISDYEKRERRRVAERREFDSLPISKITDLRDPGEFNQLPLSNDDGLLSAIEQAHDEYEEDEEVRALAVRILARFKNRNAIVALNELALYDVSSHIRSEAVTALADFDHESVFESLLLACADPTREVRASAARALFRLGFNRADSWTRLASCGDEFRIVRAARAAIESELVDRSIDRLVHEDPGYAYEAFALVALLINAGETKEIFDVMHNQRNKMVKLALLHCLKVVKHPDTLQTLYNYVERNSLPEDLSNAVTEVIKSFDTVPA
ncbi:MAG: HEAT repeat domain-containing protein [Pyrinomonadaceae bacterium]